MTDPNKIAIEQLKQEIHELQFKQVFQEDHIEQLNFAIAEQQQQIMLLERQIKLLASRVNEFNQPVPTSEEVNEPPPPHY